MSSNRNQQDASQREQRNQTLLLHIGINVVITSILFWLTINDDETLHRTHLTNIHGSAMGSYRSRHSVPAGLLGARLEARSSR